VNIDMNYTVQCQARCGELDEDRRDTMPWWRCSKCRRISWTVKSRPTQYSAAEIVFALQVDYFLILYCTVLATVVLSSDASATEVNPR